MSQYPPPGNPQYPPQYPPPGYPPQYPPPGMYPPPPSRTSMAAVFGFICGLIFCGAGPIWLLGLLLSIVGISATGKPGVKGRGLAITGLVLNLLGLLLWGGSAVGLLVSWQQTTAQQQTARTYVADVSAGGVKLLEAGTLFSADHLDSVSATATRIEKENKLIGSNATLKVWIAAVSNAQLTPDRPMQQVGFVIGKVVSADGTSRWAIFRLVQDNGTWKIFDVNIVGE